METLKNLKCTYLRSSTDGDGGSKTRWKMQMQKIQFQWFIEKVKLQKAYWQGKQVQTKVTENPEQAAGQGSVIGFRVADLQVQVAERGTKQHDKWAGN